MKVFLIGFMGSGKTTAAKELSIISGLSFYDMDQMLEVRYDKSIAAIFAENGETFFRKAERELLIELAEKTDCIIATGGGTPCYYDHMELINRNGISVYLQCSVEELFGWLKYHKAERPLLRDKSDEELKLFILEELNQREPFYLQAKLKVEIYKTNANELWERILSC
jgi:shikimate kinase